MRPMTVRIARAIACALLLLAVTGNVAFLEQEGGYGAANHSSGLRPGGDCYLRMERRGSQIRAALSPNGTNWNALKPIDTILPDRIKVGLMAITTSNTPFTVKFEQYDFKAGGPAGEQ